MWFSDWTDDASAVFQVFDGHDGEAAAIYVKEHLLRYILEDVSFPTATEDAVKNAYLELDKKFSDACRLDDSLSSGTTVLSALLQGRSVDVHAYDFVICFFFQPPDTASCE